MDFSHLELEISVVLPKSIYTGSILSYTGELETPQIQIHIKGSDKNSRKEAEQIKVGIKKWLSSLNVVSSPYELNLTTIRIPLTILPESWRSDQISLAGKSSNSPLFAIASAIQDGIRSSLSQNQIRGIKYTLKQDVAPL